MPRTPWQSQGYTATVQLADFRAVVDLRRPHDGLGELVVAGQRLDATRLLGIAGLSTADAPGLPPIEHYVRGTDLVVAYEETGQRPVRVDVLWQATAPAATDKFLAAVDLIISVRTHVLESCPESSVQSVVAADEALWLRDSAPVAMTLTAPMAIGPQDGMGPLLFRLPGLDVSYAEMVHPADFQYDELSRDEPGGNALRIAHRLFRTTLEKGVILRTSVRGIFINRRNDAENAAECYAALAAADPPLGT